MPDWLEFLDTSADIDTDIVLLFKSQKNVIASDISLYFFLLSNIISFYEVVVANDGQVKKGFIKDMSDDDQLDCEINKLNDAVRMLYNTKNYTGSSFLELFKCSNNIEFSVNLIMILKDRARESIIKDLVGFGAPDIKITQISFNSPLKIKIKNASFALVLGIVISGGEMQANGFSFKVNSLADAIIKLKEAFWKPGKIVLDDDIKKKVFLSSGVNIIVKDMLCLDKVGNDYDLFELGMDSLLAVKLISRIRSEFGIDVPLREFFMKPTVNGICEVIISLIPSSLELHADKLFSNQ